MVSYISSKLVVEFGTSCVAIFPLAEAIQALRSKIYLMKHVIQGRVSSSLNLASETAPDRGKLMPRLRRQNKLSDGMIIIFLCCFVFAQSTRVTDRQTDIEVTADQSHMLSAYCDRPKKCRQIITLPD
jgi:hypothetical protein